MPLVAVPVDLPADVSELRAGDIDGDGRDELIAVSRRPQGGGRPDTVTLTVLSVGGAGASVVKTIPLGDEAVLWDIHSGLWGVDARGARDLMTGERVVAQQTMLALLGPTMPRAADVADDLDGNGTVELMLPAQGQLAVFTASGEPVGGIPVRATGELSTRSRSGGTVLVAASTLPATVIADLDGDGLRDVLLPAGRRAVGWRTTPTACGAEEVAMRLPVDLDPDDGPDRPDSQLAGSWFIDLDGDGKLDLATHHRVSSGSWFGSTAKLTAYPGTGTGWQPGQAMQTDRAAFDVQLRDIDGDGDQDILVTEVDVSLSNMGRALVARAVQVELVLYAMDGGRYPATPQPVRTLSWPLEKPERMLIAIEGDLDGDGWLDLVTNDGGEQLRVYPGSAAGFASTAAASASVGASRRGDDLFVRDLTGDGRAEVLFWRPGETRATLLQLP